jgi:hypothetical protein
LFIRTLGESLKRIRNENTIFAVGRCVRIDDIMKSQGPALNIQTDSCIGMKHTISDIKKGSQAKEEEEEEGEDGGILKKSLMETTWFPAVRLSCFLEDLRFLLLCRSNK